MLKHWKTTLLMLLAGLSLGSCTVNQSSSSSLETSSSSLETSSSSSSSLISSSLPSSNSGASSDLDSTYYAGINWSAESSLLVSSLSTLLKGKCTHIVQYNENNTILAQSDKDPTGATNKIVSFYDNVLIGPAWDSGDTWNKEHVWPQSRGVAKANAGADPQMIRPCSRQTNSGRGNNFFGSNTKSSLEYDPGQYGYPEYRGMATRIIFYTAVRWADTGLSLSDDPSDATSKKTMGKVSDLLKWNLDYPVTTLETQRNEYLAAHVNGVRNPFIDHPKAASTIWGNYNDATRKAVGLA